MCVCARRLFPFTLNGVMLYIAVALIAVESWGEFNFSSGSTGASQLKRVYVNIPGQAQANLIAFMLICKAKKKDTP